MKKFAYLFGSTILVFACAVICPAQRIDTTEARQRERDRQRALDDPANNPFNRIGNSSDVPTPKSQPPERGPLRVMVELKVVGIADGDTLIISNTANQHLLIRLQGIDAPETGQAFSRESLENLTNLVSGKSVTVEFDPHGKPDSEGRVVAKVMLEGLDIALEQIKNGFAWYCKDYKKEQSESDRYTYAEAEKEARDATRGLWKEAAPQPPWKYRKQ
ncbi:MAG: thermonuclease family protein [Acidobacteria bacterium]|nr:thermonuclease family protein [Acidobacteriota bacterium]